MDMTLNEYLGEVDRWKQLVSDRTARLDPAERARADREAIDWLERQLGRRLKEASSPELTASPSGFHGTA
ncbi:MAG: hypothetical protein Q7R41_08315 [Phycisphaerales bacterium]|nr:hypothetical protein [Phycisphaerales bacterium]